MCTEENIEDAVLPCFKQHCWAVEFIQATKIEEVWQVLFITLFYIGVWPVFRLKNSKYFIRALNKKYMQNVEHSKIHKDSNIETTLMENFEKRNVIMSIVSHLKSSVIESNDSKKSKEHSGAENFILISVWTWHMGSRW
jgi:hypothetical protein